MVSLSTLLRMCGCPLGLLCLALPANSERRLAVASSFDWKSKCYEYELPRALATATYKGDQRLIQATVWRSLEVRQLDEGAVVISLPESTRAWYPNPLRFIFTTPPAPKMLAEVDNAHWLDGTKPLITANGNLLYSPLSFHQIWDVRQYGPRPKECDAHESRALRIPPSSYLSRYCEWGNLARIDRPIIDGVLYSRFGGTPPKGTLEQSIFRLGNPSPILTFRLDFHGESPSSFIYLSWIDANRFLLPLGDKDARRFLACTLEPSPDGPTKTLQKR